MVFARRGAGPTSATQRQEAPAGRKVGRDRGGIQRLPLPVAPTHTRTHLAHTCLEPRGGKLLYIVLRYTLILAHALGPHNATRVQAQAIAL